MSACWASELTQNDYSNARKVCKSHSRFWISEDTYTRKEENRGGLQIQNTKKTANGKVLIKDNVMKRGFIW